MITEILAATGNADKLREIQAILGPLGFRVRPFPPPLPDVPEDAPDFLGNAEQKALACARQALATGALPVLADDSGLEVDALGGAPGVRSARYAGRHGDAAANNAKLLHALAGRSPAERQARFRCAVVLADARGIIARAQGTVEGHILEAPQGGGGFGYDPLFLPDEDQVSFAALSAERKQAISHRGRALRELAHLLQPGR